MMAKRLQRVAQAASAAAVLDAAETAFAGGCFDGVSLRAIMRTAGVNPAAVHYHFGSRQELARAVLDRVLAPLQRRRLQLLTDLEQVADAQPIELGSLLAALVRPDLEAVLDLRQRNPEAVRLIGSIYLEPSRFVKSLVEESFAPVAARYMRYLATAVPEVPPAELSWRVRWCLFGTLGALLSDVDLDLGDTNVARYLGRLVSALSGALQAVPQEETTW